MNVPPELQRYQSHFNNALAIYLSEQKEIAPNLLKAMRYSALAGGKRIRPALIYATGQTFGAKLEDLDAPAIAIELIHAYSLIHDDLPAMDNSDLRRGKPTCHKAFNEATAILAGDALQSLAFDILANHTHPSLPDHNRVKMIATLAKASGIEGMASGQAIDLENSNNLLTLDSLEQMHRYKTGALIRASIQLGALAAGHSNEKKLKQLDIYADHLGLAFQIKDDLLDIESSTEQLGKPQGLDEKNKKTTYPSLLGLNETKEKLALIHQRALDTLSEVSKPNSVLHSLTEFFITRTC